MKDANFNSTVFKNGLKLISYYKKSNIFSMCLGIGVGSLYECQENNGISHMIEHMLFKGTKKRSMEELNYDIERLAGNFDVYTTYNHTAFDIDIMKEKAESCIEIVSDMLMNSVFPEKEFMLEKKVIVEEIKMDEDDAEEQAYLGFYKHAFPKEWYKFYIAGTIKSVKGIKLQSLKDFYKRHYIPENVTICITSSYSHKELEKIITRYFGEWEVSSAKEGLVGNYIFAPGVYERQKKGISQGHIIYGFDIRNLNRREEAALTIISKKLGSGGNSILFRELRDKRGYAYSVYSDIDFVSNFKMFNIYAGVSKQNIRDSIIVIDEIINKLKTSTLKISREDIELIRDMFITDTEIALESSSHIADYMLDGEINYGNPMEYMDFLMELEAIGEEDVKRLIEKIFNNPAVHILIPA